MYDITLIDKILSTYKYFNLDWLIFCYKNSKIQLFKKGELILSPGHTDRNVYFIISGLLRSFTIHKGEDKTLWFGSEFDNMIFHEPVLLNEPSIGGLEALEDSTLCIIPYGLMEKFELKNVQNATVANKWLKDFVIMVIERKYSLLLLDAEERYLLFQEMYPVWSESIPLKYIASYLGITQETLSRIRNNISKKKPAKSKPISTLFKKNKDKIGWLALK